MSLPIPELDDKRFDDLMNEARTLIPIYNKEWTNHNPSDPGITLLELFAWLTEMTLYRLNQVPEANYLQFVELIGGDCLKVIDCQSPSIQKLKIQYDAIKVDPDLSFFNERLINLTRDIRPFGKIPKLNDTFYLGSKEAFAQQGTTVGIQVELSDSIIPNMKSVELIWEFHDGEQWALIGKTTQQGVSTDNAQAPYSFTDTTKAFMQNGRVEFICPTIKPYIVNDKENYWIRARITGDNGDLEFKIREGLALMARQTRAITSRDYENLALECMEQLEDGLAGRAICMNNRDLEYSLKNQVKPGHVTVLIIPKQNGTSPYQNNGVATDPLKLKVKEYLNSRRLITTRIHVVAPKYKEIKIAITISLKTNLNETAVLEAAAQEVAAYFDPILGGPGGTGWPLGRAVYRSELYGLLEGIDGVDHVGKLTFDDEEISFVELDEDQLLKPDINMEKK